MLSRLQATSQLTKVFQSRPQFVWKTFESNHKLLPNHVISKRWSGHNAMTIKPSNADWLYFKNWLHFYILLGIVPMAIFVTILGIRANPELSEVPDGYEPRHWEYYKHPIARWMARYMVNPASLENEVYMAREEYASEQRMLGLLMADITKVMRFYQDHRSMYFKPSFGDYFRIGREEGLYGVPFTRTETNYRIEHAYDPDTNPIPTEGFLEGPKDRR